MAILVAEVAAKGFQEIRYPVGSPAGGKARTRSNMAWEYSLTEGKMRKKRRLAGEYSPARCT